MFAVVYGCFLSLQKALSPAHGFALKSLKQSQHPNAPLTVTLHLFVCCFSLFWRNVQILNASWKKCWHCTVLCAISKDWAGPWNLNLHTCADTLWQLCSAQLKMLSAWNHYKLLTVRWEKQRLQQKTHLFLWPFHSVPSGARLGHTAPPVQNVCISGSFLAKIFFHAGSWAKQEWVYKEF